MNQRREEWFVLTVLLSMTWTRWVGTDKSVTFVRYDGHLCQSNRWVAMRDREWTKQEIRWRERTGEDDRVGGWKIWEERREEVGFPFCPVILKTERPRPLSEVQGDTWESVAHVQKAWHPHVYIHTYTTIKATLAVEIFRSDRYVALFRS